MGNWDKAYNLLYAELKRLNNGHVQCLYAADPNTGEMVPVVEEVSKEVERIIKAGMNRQREFEFVFLYQEQEKELVRELSPSALKVFCYLRAYMKYENVLFGITNKAISEGAGIGTRSVHRAVCELEEKNIIISRGGKKKIYHINPVISWKGAMFQQKNKLKFFTEEINKIKLDALARAGGPAQQVYTDDVPFTE